MARVRFLLFGAGLLLGLSSASVANAQTTCYVDSVAGDDTKSGLSEDEATQSRNKIASTCSTVKFKRGSVFQVPAGEQIVTMGYNSKLKTLTNYGDPSLPLPKFVKTRSPNNGGMISAYQGGLTIDGLYLSGSQSDAQMSNLGQGICIMAGSNTKIINNEITECDIGMMLSGTGSLVQNNYVHDLHVSVDAAPGVDPNVVGGAEGIFVNGSNNEVAYNSFINCSNYAEWTGGSCDGGATEVTVGAGGSLSGVKIHHNFGYNNCGFFEVSSGFGDSSSTTTSPSTAAGCPCCRSRTPTCTTSAGRTTRSSSTRARPMPASWSSCTRRWPRGCQAGNSTRTASTGPTTCSSRTG